MLLKLILGLAISGNCVIDLDYIGERVHRTYNKTYNTYWFYSSDYRLLLDFPYSDIVDISLENDILKTTVDNRHIYNRVVYKHYKYNLKTREWSWVFITYEE
jgi:hypothetical protein|tara:strand:+ start:1702 stop:2007 length:306 start_codon:yes stop_codon:yes gene_type:complete